MSIEQQRQADKQAVIRVIQWFRRQGWDDGMLNQLLGDVSGLVPPISANIQITYTAERVALLSEIDQTVHLTGDVRDQHIMLSAGVPKSRALTAEGNGWVAVNSERYPRPA